MHCPVCESSDVRPFAEVAERRYWRCEVCVATFLDPAQRPGMEIEKAEYALHRNDPGDLAYRAFLGRLATPLLERLASSPEAYHGLDYGCGPSPVLADMLREAGHAMAVYDPLFFDDRPLLDRPYDFITCTEVVEHFHRPAEEFARLDGLLAPGGWLAVMTGFTRDTHDFARWHYRRDPTHVVFYREETFEVLAGRHGWRCEFPRDNVALLRKGPAVLTRD